MTQSTIQFTHFHLINTQQPHIIMLVILLGNDKGDKIEGEITDMSENYICLN